MRIRTLAGAALAASLLIACAGAPKEIPTELTPRELVQRAQESSDVYNYAAALAYYHALDERFGSDPLYKTTADYEIAYIAYKQGHYAEAKQDFEALLARYAGPEGASLPPRYSVLAKKMLDTIATKTKAKK